MASAAKVEAEPSHPSLARERWPRRWLLALTAAWTVLLAAAVAGTIAAALQIEPGYRLYPQPFLALGLRPAEVNNELTIVGAYVRAAGGATPRPSGVILSVDGHPAPSAFRDRFEIGRLLAAASGSIVTVRMRSPDGKISDHALERSDMWLTTAYAGTGWTHHRLWIEDGISVALIHATLVFAGVLLFVRARRRVAVLLSVSLLMHAASGVQGLPTYVEPLWGPFALAPPLLAALGWGGLLLATLVFPEGRFDPPWIRWLLPVVAAQVVVLAVYGYGVIDAPWIIWAYPGLFLVAVAVQVWRYRRLPPGVQRQQIRWALFGFSCAAVCGVAMSVVSELANREADNLVLFAWLAAAFPFLFLLATVAYVTGLVVSLLRYRLYDADTVISRSAALAIITVTLAAVWAGAERGLEVAFAGRFGHQAEALSVGLAATLAALLVKPVHERVHLWTEEVFQKALAHLRRDLPPCVADLRETASVARLAAVALERISLGVRATQGAIVLADGHGLKLGAVRGVSIRAARAWLRAAASALVGHELLRGEVGDLFPLRLPLTVANEGPREAVAWLLLGPRPDGSFYGRDELETLNEVADPVARALQIVRIRQARERAQDRRLADLTAQVVALREGRLRSISS